MSFLNSARCTTFLDFSVVNLKLRTFFSASPAELVVLGKNSLSSAKKTLKLMHGVRHDRWRCRHRP
eukprot:6367328-Pyramimonas_sp.AAC.1